jgi:hypothetical protein
MNRIPAGAAALINRARAAGADIAENLIDSPYGPIGHVKVKAPDASRAFMIVFVSEPHLQSGARRVIYHTSAGHVTRATAELALATFEREQLAAVHAQLDEVLGRPAPAELLTCEGCGATYADSMDHTQGEHDRRLREREVLPAVLAVVTRDAEAAAGATDRRVRDLNHRIVGALIKLALPPDEMPIVVQAAWAHIHSTGPIDQEAFLRGFDAELQARVAALDVDAWADEAPGDRPVSPATGCCGHACERVA